MIKLLVVDDETSLCEYIGNFFKYRGYEVITETDSTKVLAIVDKEKPQIVLLDILMPRLSGLDILKKIKEKYAGEIKVLMLTIEADAATMEKAIAYGADAFMQKPFSTPMLEDVVMRKIGEILGYSKKEEKKDANT